MLPIPHPCPVLHHPRRGGLHRHVPRLLHLQLPSDNPAVSQRDVDSPHTPGSPKHLYFRLIRGLNIFSVDCVDRFAERKLQGRKEWLRGQRLWGGRKWEKEKIKILFFNSYNRFDKSYDYVKPLYKVHLKWWVGKSFDIIAPWCIVLLLLLPWAVVFRVFLTVTPDVVYRLTFGQRAVYCLKIRIFFFSITFFDVPWITDMSRRCGGIEELWGDHWKCSRQGTPGGDLNIWGRQK